MYFSFRKYYKILTWYLIFQFPESLEWAFNIKVKKLLIFFFNRKDVCSINSTFDKYTTDSTVYEYNDNF